MRRLSPIVALIFLVVACSKSTAPAPKVPERLPITEQAKELTEVPPYQAPTKDGKVVGLELDAPAPFSGVLLTEDKAMAAAELRIAYDEVYQLAIADRKYMLNIVQIQEQQLYRADAIIDQKEAELKAIRDDWWEKNKLQVGIGVGLVLGVGLSLLTGKIWAEIEEDQK